jgi:hypothetical protein
MLVDDLRANTSRKLNGEVVELRDLRLGSNPVHQKHCCAFPVVVEMNS